MSTTASSGLKKVSQRRAIEASLQNEQITRGRVTRLERQASSLEATIGKWNALVSMSNVIYCHRNAIEDLEVILHRGFWGRFKWLVTGK